MHAPPQPAMCVFCTEGASGDTGHPGMAQQAHGIASSERGYVQLKCEFCGTVWARRRINARLIEWLRVAR